MCPVTGTYRDRMKLRTVPAALIVVACGAGLTACGAEPGTPSAGSGYGTSASAPSPGGSGVLGMIGITVKAPPPTTSRPRQTSSPAATRTAGPSPSTSPSPRTNPATSASPASSGGSGASAGAGGAVSFTVPGVAGDNVVSAYGSYTKINAEKVKVTVCARQTGTAYSVGAIALAYNTSGASKNVGAVVLTGPGNTSCGTITFLFYSAHLAVHAFVGGTSGNIAKTGPVLSLY